jgi:hypothetical protein
LRKTASRYQKASKKYKETILDEFVQSTGYHRTYASFLLSHHGKRVVIARKTSIVGDIRKRVRKKREPVYGTEGLAEALRILLNAAMLFERERFLVAAPFKQWRERLLGRWFICSWMPAMRKSARAA